MVEEEVKPANVPVVKVPMGRGSAAQRRQFEQPELPTPREIEAHSWYIVQVASNREQLTADLLRHRAHLAVVPVVERYRRANRYARSKRKVTFPIMPRYVIVGFGRDAMQPWRDLFGIGFVQGVVSDARGPMQVRDKKLAKFFEELGGSKWNAPDWERHMRSGHEFKPGDYVDLAEGSLAGWRVQVHDIVGDVAKIIINNLLGRDVEMSVPLAQLIKAE